MEINLTRDDKIELLKACQSGILNTANLPALNKILENAQPARILTKQEAQEYITTIEKEY